MLSSKSNTKRLAGVLSLGLGILVVVLALSWLNLRNPVQAQDPDPYPFDPATLAMEPSPMQEALPLRVSVNYADNIIEEGYPEDNTVWITVTSPSNVVKGTIELVTGVVPWWHPDQRGFSTELGTWVPGKPDIVPGDWVHASSSLGHSTSVQVGTITGFINPATDVITGTVYAPWVPAPHVEVKCKAFNPETGEFRQVFDVSTNRVTLPDGVDVYTCDFTSVWDLRPGHLVAVSFDWLRPTTRSNRTVNVFAVPGPHLQIRKWVPGAPGALSSGPSGNLVFNVEYRNIGPHDATNVTITDEMGGLIYHSDTSGLPRSGSGAGPITWQVGTVPAGAVVQFQLFATIDGAAGSGVTNTLQISSNPAPNMGLNTERRASWSSTVQQNGAWLSVNKHAQTPNPLPGSEFVYVSEVCNTDHRWAVDSSTATLTETLLSGTTLVTWWAEQGGWTESSRSSTQLVLTRPSIAARGCTNVYLRVRVPSEAIPGAALCNSAAIQADNNTTSQAAQITFCNAVGTPQANLAIDKHWAGGTLVPGGEIRYDIEVRNTGNTALSGPVLVTDTLPTAATFLGAELDPDSPISFNPTPIQQTGSQVVWQIPLPAPGDRAAFSVALRLSDSADVGSAVINTVEVGRAGLDEDRSDNIATWEETVQASGPNLRILKTAEWANRGARTDRVNYRLIVENIGDLGAYDVVVTDSYDSRLTLEPGLRVDAWETVVITYTSSAHTFSVRKDLLKPGERFHIDFATTTTTRPVVPGLIFTNTATVTPLHADTDTGNNTAVVEIASGPDLDLVKRLEEGLPHPGELVTFLLTYRNAIPATSWWWTMKGEALLTDLLPGGLEFVSATQWRCGATTWCDAPPDAVDGQQLTWNVGRLQAGEVNALRVTARIRSTVGDQTQLTNQAFIASTEDADGEMGNNSDTATLIVSVPATGPHTLTRTTVGQGEITVVPDQPSYAEGQQITLTAIPDLGWSFAGWSGSVTGTENPLVVTITGDMNVVATFTSIPYTLDITLIGEGTVTRTPDKPFYHYGEQVLLTATPDTGWLFTGWTGERTGADPDLVVVITGDTAVTATFIPSTLAVTKAVTPTENVEPGSVITYTIALNNTSTEVDLIGVEMIDQLPDGVIFGGFTDTTNISPAPQVTHNTITWSGDLPAGVQPPVIVFTATFTGGLSHGRQIINRAIFRLDAAPGAIAIAEAGFTPAGSTTLYLPLLFR